MKERETFASRLGFVLISAGCAIGLGNVWRFPYIVGQYGGAAFVVIYLVFLVIMGLPIMAMEFSVGRASRQSIATSFQTLEPKGSKWHWYSWFGMAGNYMLMMFYTTVAGWMVYYFVKMARGDFVGADAAGVEEQFGALMGEPVTMLIFMVLVVLLCMGICALGLQNGVERITKVMMLCLLAIMAVLAVRSLTLEGGAEGLKFYLQPNFKNLMYDANGKWRLGESIFAAMGQAFFTLSLGIGAIAVFGSYIDRQYALGGEALRIGILDTFVAFVAGLIIFPACSAFSVEPTQGPPLIFMTLPRVFADMAGGRLWGALFFLFMTFASFSTVIAVFENLLANCMDNFGWSRKKAAWINCVFMLIASMPCLLGYNVLANFHPFLDKDVLDCEDFIVSNLLLPLGSLIYLLFCVSKWGWGYDKYLDEANAGSGLKFSRGALLRGYLRYVLPVLILVILVVGLPNTMWRLCVGAAVVLLVVLMANRSKN